MKVNKVYPSFFNGVSQQKSELILDNQCKDMNNCVPDIVLGLTKRPPVKYVIRGTNLPDSKVFHTYDRGEGSEEYIMLETGDYDEPIMVFSKYGVKQTVTTPSTAIKDYLAEGELKGLTVQDRTWILSKNAEVDIDYTTTAPLAPDYTKEAYYWIKRGSGDRYNPYNYAVYLNGLTASCNPNKPSGDDQDPETGFEDSDYAAKYLADLINRDIYVTRNYSTSVPAGSTVNFEIHMGVDLVDFTYNIDGTDITGTASYSSTTGLLTGSFTNSSTVSANTGTFTSSAQFPTGWTAEVLGSVIKIVKTDGSDFTFTSWDSWGQQASEGWKGSVNKITDLPKEMPFDDVYVRIEGDSNDTFTDYFVKWNGSSWEECLDPEADRGTLTNMPIKMDRVSITEGIATFEMDVIEWSEPRVGNLDNNPDPSFAPDPETGAKRTLKDLFFYKNRLGVASEDSVTLTETANYTNFYIKTTTNILDTDPIDLTVAANQASKIYFVKPFNNSLYIFTKYSQYELSYEGGFSPKTVSLNNTSNYPMATNVEPVVVNDSLYFISNTDNRQQLREYIKKDNLNVAGIDLNVSTPTYLSEPITKLIADGVLGYVLCCTDSNLIYFYNHKEDGDKRIQSAWNKWTLFQDNTDGGTFEFFKLASTVIVTWRVDTDDYRMHHLQLDNIIEDDNVDTTYGLEEDTEYNYECSILLPDYYPQITGVRTPKDKMLIKKVIIEGEGNFDADVYRKDYNTTFSKYFDKSLRDKDLHVASKVGNVDITIKDSSLDDFVISSIVVEGLFNSTSRELK
jgi:hypothetical protein